jgi:N utilization substance protein B
MTNSKKTPLRHLNRQCAVQFLYMWDVQKRDSLEAALNHFFELQEKDRQVYGFAEDLIHGALENMPKVDEAIKKYSQNWTFERIAKVDLAILRLAVFELLFRIDIPPIVSINEAIELSKELSTVDSKRFINGILDKLKLNLTRPLRSAEKAEEKESDKELEEE